MIKSSPTLSQQLKTVQSLALRADNVKTVLDNRLRQFEFEESAVFIQVPQVPPASVQAKIAQDRGYFCYPPQALFYISATLENMSIPTRLLDLNFIVLKEAQNPIGAPDQAWRTALDKALACFQKPVVGVSFMFDATFPQLEQVCQHIKKNYPELCLLVGGVAATADPEKILQAHLADFVIVNEAEEPLTHLYAYLRKQRSDLPGNIFFLDNAGLVVHTPVKPGGPVDLDIRREFHKLPVAEYHQAGSLNNFSRMRGNQIPYATISSRRGCRGHCTFCAVRNFSGKGVRKRPVQSVVDEMVYLHDRFGIRHFDWLDDDLLFDPAAALTLFREIGHCLPNITWGAHNGLIAGSVTPEILTAMEQSGCLGFGVGLESGNPQMLRKIRKPATISGFIQYSRLVKEFPRLLYLVNFIIGLPEESFGQMLDSFRLSLRARLDWTNFFTYQPLKNTEASLASGGWSSDRPDENLTQYGTTLNFNPIRSGSFTHIRSDGIKTGLDIFDQDAGAYPNSEQCKEIWFTFNSITNFIRMPALTTSSEPRIRNAIRWLAALGSAYTDNPAIDCVLYYLKNRLNDGLMTDLSSLREKTLSKFQASSYWRRRDEQFHFSDLLAGKIPQGDRRLDGWDQELVNP